MMRSVRFKAAMLTIASAIVAAAPRIANACATCGLSDSDHASHAYKASVLFMIASPYAAFFAIGGGVYYVYRRSLRQDRNSTTK